MTHVVKIDILIGHEEMGTLHFILKLIFNCIFIEKQCIFSKLVQLFMKVWHIVQRNFVTRIGKVSQKVAPLLKDFMTLLCNYLFDMGYFL